MKLRIGKTPKSIAEIAKMNRKACSVIGKKSITQSQKVLMVAIKKLLLEGKITPIFDEQDGVKLCLWKRI
jgi:hypothetical protein